MKKRFLLTVILALIISILLQAAPQRENNPIGKILDGALNQSLSSMKGTSGQPLMSEILYSLGNLYSYLEQNFLYDIDMEEMKENLISAMVDSLGDKYSYYIAADDAESYENDYEGEYVGIGTYLTKVNPAYADPTIPETYMIIITSPFPGGPADRAGLRANDLISHIDGEDISAMDANEASKLLRGEEGKDITITVHRGDSVFDLTLRPEHVIIPTVVAGMLDSQIGYLQIAEFANTTSERVKEELTKLQGQGMKALVIDLRNDAGGSVQPALEIADMFLDAGTIMTVRYKEGSGHGAISYAAMDDTEISEDIPIAILVNGGTASASEILTAALCENSRAFSVGDVTFGKGITQSIIPYGDGFIQFTSANWYTPQGNLIHEKGITPDVLIPEKEYSDEEMVAYENFMMEDHFSSFRQMHPEYTKDNVDLFAEENKDTGVPVEILRNLITKEYVYSMDFDERPIADLYYDEVLLSSMDMLRERI